eukprot:1159378-Pelagomonas_calceolata.AAC.6
MKGDFDSCLWRGIAWERGHRFNGLWKSCGTILFREGHVLHSNGAARPYMSAVKWYCMHLQPNDTKHRAWGCSRGLIVGAKAICTWFYAALALEGFLHCAIRAFLLCNFWPSRSFLYCAVLLCASQELPSRAPLLSYSAVNLLEGVLGQQEPQQGQSPP